MYSHALYKYLWLYNVLKQQKKIKWSNGKKQNDKKITKLRNWVYHRVIVPWLFQNTISSVSGVLPVP